MAHSVDTSIPAQAMYLFSSLCITAFPGHLSGLIATFSNFCQYCIIDPSTNKPPEHCSSEFHCNWLLNRDKGWAKQSEIGRFSSP